MLPRLGTHHLSLLVALAETGSVAAAGTRLGITQSAASHRLREAERRLGVDLVRRNPSGATLTRDGERLRGFAARFLQELSGLEQEIETAQASGRRLVRLGQATYSRYHWLPAFLEFFERREPSLLFDLSGSATTRPLGALQEGTVDVSTIYGRPIGPRRFAWQRIGTDPVVCVMAPDHRLAGEPFVDSTTLGDERVFFYPFASEPGFDWETMLGPPTTPYRRWTTMPTPEAVIDLLRAGYGVCLFSRWAIEPELAAGTLIAKPIGPDGGALDWWAVTRADDPPDAPSHRLVQALVDWAGGAAIGLGTLSFESSGETTAEKAG